MFLKYSGQLKLLKTFNQMDHIESNFMNVLGESPLRPRPGDVFPGTDVSGSSSGSPDSRSSSSSDSDTISPDASVAESTQQSTTAGKKRGTLSQATRVMPARASKSQKK